MEPDDLDSYLNEEGSAPVLNAVQPEPADAPSKKRKNAQDNEASKKPKVQENRAIYVTKLPIDTNEGEIEDVFKKYGIIDQGADGNKRIKMYTDSNGDFNGEALIVYFKKESIPLAINMMDDYFFRYDEPENKISVKEADLSYKRNTDGEKVAAKLTRKDKKASERTRADLNRKLAEWSDNEEEVARAYAPKKNQWAKICIVKYGFTLKELAEEPGALLDIKDEFREEATEVGGEVTNVTLYDLEEDGIVSVRFKEFEAAEKFRDATHGRKFARRTLEAWLAEDRPKFKKSLANQDDKDDDKEPSPTSDDVQKTTEA